jgi:hypothetical protein
MFRKLLAGAALLAFLGILGYGAWRAYDNLILTPYKRVGEYNRGERVYDPFEQILSAPVRADEGFVCPGAMLYSVPGVGSLKVTRTTKVKAIEKFGADVIGVKLFDGGDINSPSSPELRMYGRDLKKSLPCPATGQPNKGEPDYGGKLKPAETNPDPDRQFRERQEDAEGQRRLKESELEMGREREGIAETGYSPGQFMCPGAALYDFHTGKKYSVTVPMKIVSIRKSSANVSTIPLRFSLQLEGIPGLFAIAPEADSTQRPKESCGVPY